MPELSTKYQPYGLGSPTFSVSLALRESGMALLGAQFLHQAKRGI